MNKPKVNFLLTARGNNSLKDKNLRLLNGLSCISYPAKTAKESKFSGNYYISSEDEKILHEVEKFGFQRIQRPSFLSKADSLHMDVLKHAIQNIEPISDILVVLLGNAPVIKKDWLDECIDKLIENPKHDSVVPVFKDNDHHPLRSKIIENNTLKPYQSSKNISSNRQELPESFFLCHNFWVIRLKNGKVPSNGDAPWPFLGKKIMPFMLDNEIPIYDIHSEIDILLLETILKDLNIS